MKWNKNAAGFAQSACERRAIDAQEKSAWPLTHSGLCRSPCCCKLSWSTVTSIIRWGQQGRGREGGTRLLRRALSVGARGVWHQRSLGYPNSGAPRGPLGSPLPAPTVELPQGVPGSCSAGLSRGSALLSCEGGWSLPALLLPTCPWQPASWVLFNKLFLEAVRQPQPVPKEGPPAVPGWVQQGPGPIACCATLPTDDPEKPGTSTGTGCMTT